MKLTIVPNGPILIETNGEWTYTGEAGPTKNKDRKSLRKLWKSVKLFM